MRGPVAAWAAACSMRRRRGSSRRPSPTCAELSAWCLDMTDFFERVAALRARASRSRWPPWWRRRSPVSAHLGDRGIVFRRRPHGRLRRRCVLVRHRPRQALEALRSAPLAARVDSTRRDRPSTTDARTRHRYDALRVGGRGRGLCRAVRPCAPARCRRRDAGCRRAGAGRAQHRLRSRLGRRCPGRARRRSSGRRGSAPSSSARDALESVAAASADPTSRPSSRRRATTTKRRLSRS